MKRKACMLIALLATLVTAINVAYILKDEFFYKIEKLPEGTLLREEIGQGVFFSSGTYLEIFEIEETDRHPAAIRVEAVNDQKDERRTIYWQIGTRESLVYWPEEQGTVVYINGVPIDYVIGSYDCRDYDNYEYVPEDGSAKSKF